MPKYRLFDLCLDSEIELSAPLAGPDRPPDGAVRIAKVTCEDKTLSSKGLLVKDSSDEYLLTIPEGAIFHCHRGKTITIEPLKNFKADLAQAMLSTHLFPAFLRQRGHHILAGTALAYREKALILLGRWGTSNLALELLKQNFHFLSDGFIAFQSEGGTTKPMVLSSLPQITVGEAQLELVDESFTSRPLRQGVPRHVIEVKTACSDKVVLGDVIFLESSWGSHSQPGWCEIAKDEAFRRILQWDSQQLSTQTSAQRASKFQFVNTLLQKFHAYRFTGRSLESAANQIAEVLSA